MKKISLFCILMLSTPAWAANSEWGNVIAQDFGSPNYLVGAADAWSALIGSPWRGGRIATRMNDMHTTHNDARMYEVLSTLAYNHSTMIIIQAHQYMQYAFSAIDVDSVTGLNNSRPKFDMTARAIGAYSDYDGSRNNNFKFRTGGGMIQASTAVTDGFSFGLAYNYTDSRSKHTPVKMKATGNVVSMFAKYMTRGGLYLNSAIAGGRIQWDADKRAVGVSDDTSFNTDTLGAAINTGVLIQRGRIHIRPQIGARYVRLSTEHFTDAAAQSYKKWWYNTLNTGGELNIGITFRGDMLTWVPHVTMGAGYDVIHNGSDHIRVGVITGQHYQMPVSAPARTHLNGGLGVTVSGGAMRAALEYRMDSVSDYISHGVNATIKISF